MLGVTSTALLAAYLWKTLPLLTGTGQTIALSPLLSFAAAAWALAAVNFGLGRQSDVILLSALRGDPSEVAIYDVAFTLTQTVGTALTVGLTGVALALFTKRHRTRPEAVGTLWRSFVALVGAAVVPFVALLVVHARSVVAAVYGPAYADAGPILRAYAIPMAVGWMLGGGASSTVLHATFRIRTVLWIRVATGVANVAANVLLIRALGPLGALLGTGVAGASAVIVEFTAVRRVLGERPDLRHVPGVALAAAAALVPSLLARPEGLVELAAHAVLFAAIYLGVLRLVRPLPRLDDGLLAALPSPIARWIGGLISTRAAPG
jgi:O-antigen/teichoic acid export membrane protein